MTGTNHSIKDDPDERWALEYMASEQRRNLRIGIAVLAVVGLSTLAILYYFGTLAASGW